MTDELLFDVRDGVARVVFNRPHARNALTFAMYERLAEVCAEVDADRGVRAMVLTGAGDKAFAAGTDIAQFRAFGSAEDALVYEARIDRVLSALERCRVPTIAAVAGACTGGGCAIAAVCDLRIAAQGARFGFPIARTLGNCLSVSSLSRLSALIGPARVKDIVFTARLLDAGEALAAGLVGEVLPDADALSARADALAALVASHAPLTMLATKEGLRRLRDGGPGADGADLVAMCYTSNDFREGMEAFLAKRPAQWTGT
ncbi:MAG: enoyl-CoA hydratase/isomerase family protein [Janthinobacterium lividum]